ncbi:MAG TPA: hypothetical protein VD963_08430 [Phycisphaerales bacterium]|nr:hypothetical protein [Phycisphaerales bacterium]
MTAPPGRTLWRLKWNLARAAAAAVLLWVLVADTPARLARAQYAALPDLDYAAEVRRLREAGRCAEALVVADAGLARAAGPEALGLATERAQAVRERDGFLRRARRLGAGALTGEAESLEGLLGAVAADMFVVGDVRDLFLQSVRYGLDGEADPVIVALSLVGLGTTAVPSADWGAAVLKAARKLGHVSEGLAGWIVAAARRGDTANLGALVADVRTIAARASPAGAARLLEHADGPADVARVAGFVRAAPDGAFALHATGRHGVRLLASGERGAEAAVGLAARKGPAGNRWLASGNWRLMLRPHPLIGLGKGLWKGNAARLAERLIASLGRHAWWLLPLSAAWLVFELGLTRRARAQPAPPPASRLRARIGLQP